MHDIPYLIYHISYIVYLSYHKSYHIVYHISYIISHIIYIVYHTSYITSHISYLMSHISSHMSYLIYYISYIISLSYFTCIIYHVTYHISYTIYHTSYIISDIWYLIYHTGIYIYIYIHEGGPKKTGFSLKKKIYLHFEKKHLIPFKILSIGGNTLVQPFFPLCEASLELMKLDVVECLLRSCFHLFHRGKSLSFQCFFFFYCRE